MRAVMYHYVRPDDPTLPFFKHLHIDDFKQQLDYFTNEFGFVSKKDLESMMGTGKVPDGVVLTFDDGIKDHAAYVLPELERRGLFGIFYVPTGPYTTNSMLNVHKIHILLGSTPAKEVRQVLQSAISPDMLIPERVREFEQVTYTLQKNDDDTKVVKQILNYFISDTHRSAIIDAVAKKLGITDRMDREQFYLSESDIAKLHTSGMIVGSHAVTHRLMSTLSTSDQKDEISNSFTFLESLTGPLEHKTFCYPYGEAHSFTQETEALLTGHGVQYSFTVDPRVVDTTDLQRPQALPRFDCNMFPHGKVRTQT